MEYTEENLQKLHSVEIEITKEILRVCRENNLEIFAHGGTLLGAIRHKGFIPWDDDMDFAMMRDDYEKFLKIAPCNLSPNFMLVHFSLNKKAPFCFIKVMKRGTTFLESGSRKRGIPHCIFVDIFPYDKLPNEEKEIRSAQRSQRFWRQAFLSRQSWFATSPHKPLKKFLLSSIRVCFHLLLLPFSPKWIFANLEKSLQRYEKERTENIGTRGFPTTVIKSGENFPLHYADFENISIPVPNDPDIVLKRLYGNYMKLPPVEKRMNHAPARLDFGNEPESKDGSQRH